MIVKLASVVISFAVMLYASFGFTSTYMGDSNIIVSGNLSAYASLEGIYDGANFRPVPKQFIKYDMDMPEDFYRQMDNNKQTVMLLGIECVCYYPVMYSGDNEFYVTHNESGESAKSGSLFLDMSSKGFVDDGATIIGHNMENSKMFSNLDLYKNEGFFRNNSYIVLFDGNAFYYYKPFSVFIMDDSQEILPRDFENGEERTTAIESLIARSMHSRLNLDMSKPILYLRTCDDISGKNNNRLIVCAVMVDKKLLDQ